MPSLTLIDILIISVLGIIYLSFSFGYERGQQLGSRRGKSEAALILKQKSLEEGQCVICNKKRENILD